MSTDTAPTNQKKAALHAAVMAQLAYLAAMGALEELYVPAGAIQDGQGNALHDLVASLAENYPGSVSKPNPTAITDAHIANLDRIYA